MNFFQCDRLSTDTGTLSSDHKKEFQASQNVELHAPKALKSVLPKHAHVIPGSKLVRRLAARARTPEPSSSAGEQEDDGSDLQKKAAARAREDESIAKQKAALRHGRPEEYTQARSKLKLASEYILNLFPDQNRS